MTEEQTRAQTYPPDPEQRDPNLNPHDPNYLRDPDSRPRTL